MDRKIVVYASVIALSATSLGAQQNGDDAARQAAARALAAHSRFEPVDRDVAVSASPTARHFTGTPVGAAHYVSYGFLPGERVADVRYTDLSGKIGVLNASAANSKGTIVFIRDAECPVSQRYSPRMAELEKKYSAKGWQFLYVDVTPHSRAEALQDMTKYGLTGRVVLDTAKNIVGALRAMSSAETFVIDSKGTLRYRGSIDDQYGIGFHKDSATTAWLVDAIDRVAADKDVAIKSTEATGCMFEVDLEAKGTPRPVTYHSRVSRIIQQKCEGCHRSGGLAPMPLQTYQQVYERRAVIAFMTKSRRMPPWNAKPGVGEWNNDASLNERDLADLQKWIETGAPQGNVAESPLPRRFVAGWSMGKPDAIVQIPDTFRIPAQGVVQYKYSYVKTNFDSDKWVTAMEIRPTAPKVVHHVLVMLEEPGRKAMNDPSRKPGDPAPSGGADGFFVGTAPGSPATVFPLGTAKKLPKGAWLKFQIHYQPNGTEVVDQTTLGFQFADDSVSAAKSFMEVESKSALNARFAIPPNTDNYEVVAQYPFRKSGTLISLFPHTHLRGKAWKIELQKLDGTKELLLDVPRYDFNWQTFYAFKKPVRVDSGMRMIATAWYDNSKNNPSNPDPNATVRFGEQTFEEMMIGYFDWIPDKPKPAAPKPSDKPATPPSTPEPVTRK